MARRYAVGAPAGQGARIPIGGAAHALATARITRSG
jgi:hypothetical protein